jgi:hypothetical protein
VNFDPIGDDARKDQASRRRGTGLNCSQCGRTKTDGVRLEWHHTAGRWNERSVVVRLCREHHVEAHELAKREGLELRDCKQHPNLLERLPDVLVGNGRYLVTLGETLITLAHQIVLLTAALERKFPAWRELPEVDIDDDQDLSGSGGDV